MWFLACGLVKNQAGCVSWTDDRKTGEAKAKTGSGKKSGSMSKNGDEIQK